MNQYTEDDVMLDSNIQTLAVVHVPMQNANFDAVFPLDEGLKKGTIFPELYLPILAVGGAR